MDTHLTVANMKVDAAIYFPTSSECFNYFPVDSTKEAQDISMSI